MTRTLVVASPTLTPLSTETPIPTDGQPSRWRCPNGDGLGRWPFCTLCGAACLDDGPFPFTVAVWQEAVHQMQPGSHERPGGPECRCGADWDRWGDACARGLAGAVVATVEVTGPSLWLPQEGSGVHPPFGWDTPVGQVTVLDRPIPHERPHTQVDVTMLDDPAPRTLDGTPDPWWWADLDLEVRT